MAVPEHWKMEVCPVCRRGPNIAGSKLCRGNGIEPHSPARWEWVEVVPVAEVERLREENEKLAAAATHVLLAHMTGPLTRADLNRLADAIPEPRPTDA